MIPATGPAYFEAAKLVDCDINLGSTQIRESDYKQLLQMNQGFVPTIVDNKQAYVINENNLYVQVGTSKKTLKQYILDIMKEGGTK